MVSSTRRGTHILEKLGEMARAVRDDGDRIQRTQRRIELLNLNI